jgi:hypothetical protein
MISFQGNSKINLEYYRGVLPPDELRDVEKYFASRNELNVQIIARIDEIIASARPIKPKKIKKVSNEQIREKLNNALKILDKLIKKYPQREYPLVLKAELLTSDKCVDNDKNRPKGKKILEMLIKRKSTNPVVYEQYILVSDRKKRKALLQKYSDRIEWQIHDEIYRWIETNESEYELNQKRRKIDEDTKKFFAAMDNCENIYTTFSNDFHYSLNEMSKTQVNKINKAFNICLNLLQKLPEKHPELDFLFYKISVLYMGFRYGLLNKKQIAELKKSLEVMIKRKPYDEYNYGKYIDMLIQQKNPKVKLFLEKIKDKLSADTYNYYLSRIKGN